MGLADYGKPGNYFERQIGRWTKQYLASSTETIEAMDRLIDWLPAHIPASARDETQVAIVHGDFRLDNLIFHPTEPRIARRARLGALDARPSAGRLQLPLHVAGTSRRASFRGIGGLDLRGARHPDRARVRAPLLRAHRPQATPDAVMADWNFYLAYNLFRLAAILQGIAKRVADGTAVERAGAPVRRRRAAAGRDGLAHRADTA